MSKMIFINLPVVDLAKSIVFYQAIGAFRDDRFADESAQCMTFSDSIHVMLLTHEKFASFTTRAIADAQQDAQVLFALSQEDRDAVEAVYNKAIAAGGTQHGEAEDHGFMISRAFTDPDGHGWQVMWMDMAAFSAVPDGASAGTQAEIDA